MLRKSFLSRFDPDEYLFVDLHTFIDYKLLPFKGESIDRNSLKLEEYRDRQDKIRTINNRCRVYQE